jgi:hypothetical protein
MVPASGGKATFSGLSIDKIGTGYTLQASSGALAVATSAPFNITIGPATQLSFSAAPGNTRAGVAFATQPVVQALDAGGNLVTTYNGAVTLAITPSAGTVGAVLGGILTVNAVNGVANFSGLNIDRIGTAYQLNAGATGLSGADSTAFNITADRLVFTTSPSNATAGTAFPTQPIVQAIDSFGTLDTNFTGAVTLAITPSTGTVGAVLASPAGVTVSAVAGVATFSGLNIDKSGVAYQLAAASGAINSTAAGDSAPFNITAGTATQLVFTTSPGNARAGAAFASQPVVEARDALGNRDTTFNGSVVLTIKSNTGAVGATLGGSLMVSAVGGVASCSGLSIDKVGLIYQLSASANGLSGADSTAFNITATGLAFTLQPVTTPAGQVFVVKVAAQDGANNTDTTFTGAVTLAIKPGTGSPRGTLGGTVMVNAVKGVADFTDLNIAKSASGYILTASASGLPSADSKPFDITGGTATRLVVTTSPSNTPAGAPLTLAVEARDTFDNLATSYAGMVDLTIASNPGGGALGGATSKAFSGGRVSFGVVEGTNINKIGIGYMLHVASGALTANSAAFNITASRLVFTAAPGTTPVGAAFAQQPVLRAEDSFGTLDTTFTGPITLTILSGTGTSGAALNGTAALAATGGVATFSRLSIDRVGTGYQLSAVAAGLPSVTSRSFDISKAMLYVPLILVPSYPDLVASFSLSTSTIVAHKPVLVTVTITNRGDAPSDPFWVDFYVNPSAPPTTSNQPWDKSCGGRRCDQGIAWYVSKTLAPGESTTLTSTPDSYFTKNTAWNGAFNTGFLNLYVYADSWNPGVSTGAVYERNETNNRAEFHTQPVLASAPTVAAALPLTDLPPLPPRPARPVGVR